MIDTSNVTRQEYLNILAPMVEPFRQISSYYRDKETIKNKFYKDLTKIKHKKDCAIPIGIGAGFLCLILMVYIGETFDIHLGFKSNCSILGLVIAIVSAVVDSLIKKRIIDVQSESLKNKAIADMTEIDEKINKIFNSIDNLDYIGQDYLYYSAISSIYSYFKNGRVNSWSEAVNLYEDELHKQRMEDIARDNLEKAANMERQLGRMASTQAIIAANTSYIAATIR